MKGQSLKRQTLVTAGNSAAVRAIGFFMRLWVSRLLGPEAVGVMELASGAHMLALTPAAAGLPGAVSRLTAKARKEEQGLILYAGRQLALRLALALTPLFLLFSPLIASWLGDMRTLPSLLLFSPCVLLVGVSSVYDGFCYGRGNAWPPAMSELTEQLVRLAVTLLLLGLLPQLTTAYRAALPAFATTVGEGLGLIVVVALAGRVPSYRKDHRLRGLRSRLWRLSLPLMVTRLSHTGLRTLCGVMIPLRLLAAGLPQSEAMSRLGTLNGMVMPLMFLPGMLAGALATVGGPAIARCETSRAEGRLIVRLLLPALGTGLLCAIGLYALAPFISQWLYRLPELTPLLRAMCPMAVLLPVQQVTGGLMTGLGLQRKALRSSLLGAAATLLCTWMWTARPEMHIYGAGYANLVGHGLTLVCSLTQLFLRDRDTKKPVAPSDPSPLPTE